MKKHQNHRYFTAVCIASAIFAVLLCLALFLIVTGDRSELDRMEAQAAVFLEQMEQAADVTEALVPAVRAAPAGPAARRRMTRTYRQPRRSRRSRRTRP
mgnify:CR=1 FL=1